MWTKEAHPCPPQSSRTSCPGAPVKSPFSGATGTVRRREEKGSGQGPSQHQDRHWLELGTRDPGRETWGNSDAHPEGPTVRAGQMSSRASGICRARGIQSSSHQRSPCPPTPPWGRGPAGSSDCLTRPPPPPCPWHVPDDVLAGMNGGTSYRQALHFSLTRHAHSLTAEYLLSTYCVPGLAQGAIDGAMLTHTASLSSGAFRLPGGCGLAQMEPGRDTSVTSQRQGARPLTRRAASGGTVGTISSQTLLISSSAL